VESLKDALEQVRQAAELKRQLEVRLDLMLRAAVRAARTHGALYAEIGAIGGFSSQTAANLEKSPYPDRRNVLTRRPESMDGWGTVAVLTDDGDLLCPESTCGWPLPLPRPVLHVPIHHTQNSQCRFSAALATPVAVHLGIRG
jgi:hypothetical protein